MKKVKLFFLLTALLAIAQGAWADTKTFTGFGQGNNAQSPVTVYCNSVYSSRAWLYSAEFIQIYVSAGYTITEVKFTVYNVNNQSPITATNGTLSNNRPYAGDIVTVSNVNNTQTVLQSNSGSYYINQIQVTYTANKYTVSFDKQSGSGGSNSVTATYGSAMPSMTKPTRAGYTFGGYYDQKNGAGTQYYNASGGSVRNWDKTANTTLYAKWTVATYTVTFDKQSGTGGSNSVTATYGSAMPSATMPTRTGYTFQGYFDATSGGTKYYNANGSSAKNWDKTANTTLYARWTANTYTVSFDKQSGTGGSNSVTATYGSAMPSATMPTRTGYTFGGYFTGTGGSGTKYYNANGSSAKSWDQTSNKTLYAKWDVVNYTISYTLNGGTATNPTNYNIETATFTLNNPTKEGYEFLGWTGSNGSTPQTEVSIAQGSTGDKSYTANWISQAAANVMGLISAIGEVTYTAESKAKIDAAREAYEALTDEQKAEVTNYATLTAAETAYAEAKTAADQAAADAVIAKINAIGTVEYTTESKALIDAAREAYDALTNDQKALISDEQLAVLTAAEATYATLVADHAAADAVIAKINAIGTVEYTEASADKIDAARIAYNALTDDQKALISDEQLAVLTAAEATYATLVADHAAADAVIAKINAIGTVEYTEASAAKIDAARIAYNALTDDQKALISDEQLAVLTAAEATYATLVADHAAADAVIAKINAIGEVEYTTESKALIDAAREAYDALTNDQKALISAEQLAVLTDAETAYATLVADHAAADAVIAKINAIGTVEYTEASADKIDAARIAYNALTDDQKALISDEQLAVLTAAEATYATLVADHAAADAVIAKINAIGTVEYTTESKALIDAAREAYDALTNDQKALISAEQLAVLTDAEATYATLVADHAAADAVIAKINAIGTVEYTEASADKIDAARIAYNALTDEQKALISDEQLAVLTAAEATYATLVADHAAADAVVELINAIGTVTADSKDAIDAARAAYEALTDDQKALVDADALDTLEAAEEAYSHLIPTALDNAAVDTKATKRIVNGQLLIERDGKTYNAQGAKVR